jgi:DNA-binding winged helix-turn-helix (wHTH) protein/Tfp pilus assembly protein PilF
MRVGVLRRLSILSQLFLNAMSSSVKHFYEFGPFRLDVANRLLLRGGEPLPLTPKAVETLLALIRNGGEVIRKDDLMKLVWPGQFVEEGNLTQHIYLLRKTLKQGASGRNYIETLPRRGYRFVGEVRESQAEAGEITAPERAATQALEEKVETGKAVEKSFGGHLCLASVTEPSDLLIHTTQSSSPGSWRRTAILLLLVIAIVVSVAAFFYPKFSGQQKTAGAEAAIIDNSEAHRAYTKGRYYWNKGTTSALEDAVESFKQAIERDPNYAPAYAGLSDAYTALNERYDMGDHLTDALPKAKDAATRALQLNAQLAEGHASLAVVKERYEMDWAGAEAEFKRAIELNPGYAYAHQQYAFHLAARARLDEAKAEIERARELEPQSLSVNGDFAEILSFAGDYGQAIEQLQRTIEIDSTDPSIASLHRLLGWTYEERGMHDKAVAEFLEALRLSNGSPERLAALRQAYDVAGMKGYWQKWFEFRQGRIKLGGVSPFSLAKVYALLGEKEKAFEYLEKAFNDHSVSVAALRFESTFNDLRSDKRYRALLHRIGLTS